MPSAGIAAVTVMALASGGCGSSSGGSADIPSEQATQLQAALDRVQLASGVSDCLAAKAAARQFTQIVDSASVDSTVKSALSEGATQVNNLVNSEICTPIGPTGVSTATSTTSSSTTTAAPPETTTTETKPPKPPEPTKPPGSTETTTTPEAPGSSANGAPGPEGNPGRPSTGGTETGGTGAGGGN